VRTAKAAASALRMSFEHLVSTSEEALDHTTSEVLPESLVSLPLRRSHHTDHLDRSCRRLLSRWTNIRDSFVAMVTLVAANVDDEPAPSNKVAIRDKSSSRKINNNKENLPSDNNNYSIADSKLDQHDSEESKPAAIGDKDVPSGDKVTTSDIVIATSEFTSILCELCLGSAPPITTSTATSESLPRITKVDIEIVTGYFDLAGYVNITAFIRFFDHHSVPPTNNNNNNNSSLMMSLDMSISPFRWSREWSVLRDSSVLRESTQQQSRQILPPPPAAKDKVATKDKAVTNDKDKAATKDKLATKDKDKAETKVDDKKTKKKEEDAKAEPSNNNNKDSLPLQIETADDKDNNNNNSDDRKAADKKDDKVAKSDKPEDKVATKSGGFCGCFGGATSAATNNNKPTVPPSTNNNNNVRKIDDPPTPMHPNNNNDNENSKENDYSDVNIHDNNNNNSNQIDLPELKRDDGFDTPSKPGKITVKPTKSLLGTGGGSGSTSGPGFGVQRLGDREDLGTQFEDRNTYNNNNNSNYSSEEENILEDGEIDPLTTNNNNITRNVRFAAQSQRRNNNKYSSSNFRK
jgi:hypothetical protein